MAPKKTDPNALLRDVVARLRRPFSGVFELAPPDLLTSTRDKGLYGYFYGKPIHRLANALSLDREVLILFSTFEDQQQRTIKIARELISESEGRLDNTIAIIVHKDPEGNHKLPKWGRNVGLVVLPIFAGRMPGSSEELERHLCFELFSHDPFDVTGPVSDDSQFYGRRNEALDLARKLQTGQIRSTLGIRKIGKTSIMNRVIAEVRAHHDCYCISLDCSKDEIWAQDAEQLMTSLGLAIRECIQQPSRYVTVTASPETLSLPAATSALLSAIRSAEKSVIIFIDEVDYITPGSPTSTIWKEEFNKFWRNFRSVYQEALRTSDCLSVMVSGVSAKWFSVGSINGVENAALSLIPEEYLTPLPRGASAAMIRKIARTAGLVIPEITANAIASAASDMPFWIRKACSYIHRNIDVSKRPMTVELETAERLISDFLDKEGGTLGQVAVSHLFRVYPELKEPCFCILDNKPESISLSRLAVLRKYGLVSPSGPIVLSGPMIENALVMFRDQQKAEEPIATVPVPQHLASSALVDWAEELAVINKERNVLEKRLRTFILNFLRADGLQQKKRGAARDRVLQALPEERRAPFSNLTADDLMERLFWLDLQAIVLREWTVFSSVFGDRTQFVKYFEVANDRPDTHAKDADELDIALQRRALKWISDRLNSV